MCRQYAYPVARFGGIGSLLAAPCAICLKSTSSTYIGETTPRHSIDHADHTDLNALDTRGAPDMHPEMSSGNQDLIEAVQGGVNAFQTRCFVKERAVLRGGSEWKESSNLTKRQCYSGPKMNLAGYDHLLSMPHSHLYIA